MGEGGGLDNQQATQRLGKRKQLTTLPRTLCAAYGGFSWRKGRDFRRRPCDVSSCFQSVSAGYLVGSLEVGGNNSEEQTPSPRVWPGSAPRLGGLAGPCPPSCAVPEHCRPARRASAFPSCALACPRLSRRLDLREDGPRAGERTSSAPRYPRLPPFLLRAGQCEAGSREV